MSSTNLNKAIPRSRIWRSGSTGDLDTTTAEESLMPYPKSIHIPVNRRQWADCGERSPQSGYACNRPSGHTGRHLFAHRHIDGTVREVWA